MPCRSLPRRGHRNQLHRVLPEDSAEYVKSTLVKVVADDQVSVVALGEPISPGPASLPCGRTS